MNEKLKTVIDLLFEVHFPSEFFQFFDLDSEKLLDEKIEVLEALKEGKNIKEIPKFYEVLELLPDNNVLWD